MRTPPTDATPTHPTPTGLAPSDLARSDLASTGRTPFAASRPESASPGDENGSVVTEYGLLAIVAATVAAAVIQWASDGAMTSLFDALMSQARDIVGL